MDKIAQRMQGNEPRERNPELVASALADSAEELGLTVARIKTEYGMKLSCVGQRDENGNFDVEIKFDIPVHGNVTGSVMRGMEGGNNGGLRVMRQIVASAVANDRIIAWQAGRQYDPVLMADPDAYAKQVGQNPEAYLQYALMQGKPAETPDATKQ